MKKKLHKSNTTSRRIRFFLIAVFLAASFTQLGWTGPSHKEYISVQVHRGDTLWQIASRVTAADADVRNTVFDIVEVNRLGHNQDIYPGQILQVPVDRAAAAQINDHPGISDS
ncbi:LysM peptidoglycan-binding domain-containing protein [Anaeroglobus geminatus]|uniref:LysM domain protein n=1 Tax=Anaeroglobus geminatus F0357 TaxID=861450 RepID=G9YHY1_9FIRM|nr:LysM peptidoglycan-binding domain-containing protein [Anaeroglobus geminatus]EHM40352.1 LysM domain protein [Anaeroglobus geminatus F0357]